MDSGMIHHIYIQSGVVPDDILLLLEHTRYWTNEEQKSGYGEV